MLLLLLSSSSSSSLSSLSSSITRTTRSFSVVSMTLTGTETGTRRWTGRTPGLPERAGVDTGTGVRAGPRVGVDDALGAGWLCEKVRGVHDCDGGTLATMSLLPLRKPPPEDVVVFVVVFVVAAADAEFSLWPGVIFCRLADGDGDLHTPSGFLKTGRACPLLSTDC